MKKETDRKLTIILTVGIFLITFLFIALICQELKYSLPSVSPLPVSETKEIKKFSSEEDFKIYLQNAAAEAEYFGMFEDIIARETMPETLGLPLVEDKTTGTERVSETNVQVRGIDEPDIVKTNGKEVYFSKEYQFIEPLPIEGISFEDQERMILPPEPIAGTVAIKAFPPADLSLLSNIDKAGDLLLDGDTLVIFSGDKIYGYDVSNPNLPKNKWEMKLENNTSIAGARLYQNKIYLVVKNIIDELSPCLIKPLTVQGMPLVVECQEIYHPVAPVLADVTFIAMVLDPASGKVENKVSFIGSSSSSIIYMSEKAAYVTYSYNDSTIKFFSDFLKEKCQDIMPPWLIEKVETLESYDISAASKMTEIEILLEKHSRSLDNDGRLKIENELRNRMADYYEEHKRELEKTGIVKIGLEEFKIDVVGNVPGHPLNQFALDEYKENLRVATTIGGQRWGFLRGMGLGKSANDVYILDKNLKVQGSVNDLGETEQIYSVRFIEDKGYVVTFRQTDPFYVLDLTDPQKPELKGELKIPGYSSYLHPITNDKILGVGAEDWQVKISLFDVSSADNPIEADKYILNENWSEALSNHHAFLLDDKHSVFFLPASQGGYVFSYKNDKLELLKAISQASVKRALYVDDYLYIISDNKIAVFDETNWEKVKEMELR